jgi:hypothetical protein
MAVNPTGQTQRVEFHDCTWRPKQREKKTVDKVLLGIE